MLVLEAYHLQLASSLQVNSFFTKTAYQISINVIVLRPRKSRDQPRSNHGLQAAGSRHDGQASCSDSLHHNDISQVYDHEPVTLLVEGYS